MGIYVVIFLLMSSSSEDSIESHINECTDIYDSHGNTYCKVGINVRTDWIEYEDMYEEHIAAVKNHNRLGLAFSNVIRFGNIDNSCECYLAEYCFDNELNNYLTAAAIAKHYSKEEIKQMYLNTVHFEGGVYGVGMASKYYFSKSYGRLDKNEREILMCMLQSIAKGSQIKTIVNRYKLSVNQEYMCCEDYFADAVIKEAADKLVQNGYSYDDAYRLIFCKGVSIYSYVDNDIQKTVNGQCDEVSELQSAIVMMDYDGHICAVGGGNSAEKISNRASVGNVKIGSTIKPFAIYALALEKGLINYSTKLKDEQQQIRCSDGNYKEWPSNSDGRYGGNITVSKAVEMSKNTIAVKVGKMIGEDDIFEYMQDKLHVDNLVLSEDGQSDLQLSALALGYLCNGMSLQRLVSEYEVFGNGGRYCGYTTFSKIVDKDNKEIIRTDNKSEKVLSAGNAYVMNRLLYNVVNGDDGTANGAKLSDVETIGKTGTVTTGDIVTSRLFVGQTPEYIAGVWIGYNDSHKIGDSMYDRAIEIWHEVMKKISHKQTKFVRNKSVKCIKYCAKSGLLADENCKKTYKGYYTDDNLPKVCKRCQ